MLAYLPHQHCAACPAVHTLYSAGQTPTPQAFLYNQEDALLCSFLQRRTTSSTTMINKLTSFLSPARVPPAVVPDRTCCSRYPQTCFLENSTQSLSLGVSMETAALLPGSSGRHQT